MYDLDFRSVSKTINCLVSDSKRDEGGQGPIVKANDVIS